MTILAIVQCWNSADPVRGFIVKWMEKLSEKAEKLIVLALEQRESSALPNIKIYSLGKERYRGFGCYLFYLWQWHKKIRKIIRDDKPDIIFTHMTPIYSVMAYPYTIKKKIPIFTWFLHPRRSLILKLAHYLSKNVISATTSSYPYKKDKLVAVGHGIDTDFFNPNYSQLSKGPLILAIGRISAVKDYTTIIEAVDLVRSAFKNKFKLLIIGSPVYGVDFDYLDSLKKLVKNLNLEDFIEFLPAVGQNELVNYYNRCWFCVNATLPGSGDKVILEAMACGRPCLTATSVFIDCLRDYYKNSFLFCYQDAYDLSRKMVFLLNKSSDEIRFMGDNLRKEVLKRHSLNNLIKNLIEVFYD